MYMYCVLGITFSQIDQFLKGYSTQLQVCMIFLAILMGTAVSNFIVDLLQYSTQIKYLF